MRAKSGTDSKLCGNHIQTFWQDVATFSPPSGSGACIEAQGDLKCGLFPPLLMEKEFFFYCHVKTALTILTRMILVLSLCLNF